jgi:hypothetical protein
MAGWPGIRVWRYPLLVFPDILQMSPLGAEPLDAGILFVGHIDLLEGRGSDGHTRYGGYPPKRAKRQIKKRYL